MRLRSVLILSLGILLLVTGVTSAQDGRGNGRGGQRPPPNGGQPPPNNGGQVGPQNGGQPPPQNGGQNGAGNGGGRGGQGGVTFPAGYATSFALYTVVDRPDNLSRLLYVNRESLAALQVGQPIPNGTTLVIETYNSTVGADGRLMRGTMTDFIHVSQKIDGRWRFGSFTASGQPADRSLADERPGTCAACHDNIQDFTFSRAQLDAFAASQVMQYFYCDLADREPCA